MKINDDIEEIFKQFLIERNKSKKFFSNGFIKRFQD